MSRREKQKATRHLSVSMRLLPALLLATPIALAQASQQQVGVDDPPLYFKQLAGPPTEFSDMAPADPLLAARHSKSALLPVTLKRDLYGRWSWESEIPVEGERWRFSVLPSSLDTAVDSWSLTIRDPITRSARPPEAWGAERRAAEFGPSGKGVPADSYELSGLAPGDYTVRIESDDPGEGFLLIEGSGPTRLFSHQAAFNQRVGQRIFLIATLYDRDLGADKPGVGSVAEALLRVRTPDRRVLVSAMHDDGMHQDGEAGDGVYGGSFLAEGAGNFDAQVVFRGRGETGIGFVRTAEHLIPVVEDDTHLLGEAATGRVRSALRLGVRLEVSAPEGAGHYRAYAEVWGTDPLSHEVSKPVAWVGGMATVEDGALELGLDTRWIALSGAQGPFELRNVRIEERNYFITMSSAERMSLALPALPPTGLSAGQIVVDEEMLSGPRPGFLGDATTSETQTPAMAAEGHKLLLVHGYCSSDVWGPVSDQFDNSAVFLDTDQSRTHDEFARLIQSFGQDWNSYSIVAHSQGGMASLHLYNNYWSGLDNAGPGRLIQSVGTPYQGTLVAVTEILRVWKCGWPWYWGLTPSGAEAWLAGIRPSSREVVNYYTTSEGDKIFWPWCDALTAALLWGPDDGVVQVEKGQLPGGINRGNKEGWCHSADKVYPPQFQDAARNAEMNANAAVAPPVPPAPTGVQASDGTYTDKVKVSWLYVPEALTYYVYRATSLADEPSLVGAGNLVGFSDYTALVDTNYFYWVKALNGWGESPLSQSDTGYRGNPPPPPPANLRASDGTYTDRVRVTWFPASGVTSYVVYRAPWPNAKKTEIGETTETLFDDLSASGMNYYWVTAIRGTDESGFSVPDTGFQFFLDVDLQSDSVTGFEVHESLFGLAAGPDFEIMGPGGHAIFKAPLVILRDGVHIGEGGKVAICAQGCWCDAISVLDHSGISSGQPEHALGTPYPGQVPTDWTAYAARIDVGGHLTLDLGEHQRIVDGVGSELYVEEVDGEDGYASDPYEVYVSIGNEYIYIGTGQGDTWFDIGASSLSAVRYVKIVGVTTDSEIDAIGGIRCEIPTK